MTPTGTIRLPVTADTSTVLGKRVTAADPTWRGLDWTNVRPDHGPHLLHPEDSAYLHVGFVWPDGKVKPTWYESVRFRVRCREWIGKRIRVGRTFAWIASIEAAEAKGDWEWIVKYGARPEVGT